MSYLNLSRSYNIRGSSTFDCKTYVIKSIRVGGIAKREISEIFHVYSSKTKYGEFDRADKFSLCGSTIILFLFRNQKVQKAGYYPKIQYIFVYSFRCKIHMHFNSVECIQESLCSSVCPSVSQSLRIFCLVLNAFKHLPYHFWITCIMGFIAFYTFFVYHLMLYTACLRVFEALVCKI